MIANAFAGTFAFLPTLDPTQKKQKSLQATARGHCKIGTTDLRPKRTTTHNMWFSIAGVSCFVDTLVVHQRDSE